MSEERKRKKKKGKDDESILENEIFHIMEVSLKEALDMALDDILKEWKEKGITNYDKRKNQRNSRRNHGI